MSQGRIGTFYSFWPMGAQLNWMKLGPGEDSHSDMIGVMKQALLFAGWLFGPAVLSLALIATVASQPNQSLGVDLYGNDEQLEAPTQVAEDLNQTEEIPNTMLLGDVEDALARSQLTIDAALETGARYAELDRGEITLDEAAELRLFAPSSALVLVDRVLEVKQDQPLSGRAHWIRGDAAMQEGDYELALESFEQVGETPVWDHLELRIISCLIELGYPTEAADRAHDLIEALIGSGYHTIHDARESRLTALWRASDWETLADEADDFLDRYEEYPRTDQLLNWLGESHLALGNLEQAATYFDQVIWDFPYRPVAEQALFSLQTLESAGIEVPTHSFNARFERARTLKFNKHWSIVADVLADLLEDYLEAYGERSFANEIRMLQFDNSYGSGDFETALYHLQEIIAQDERGVSSHEVYSELSLTYARLGQFEDGAEALRQRDEDRNRARRHLELGEYYHDNGFFTESLQHYREALSERSQRGWSFSFLLFMAGEYDTAAVHLEYLAEHSSGRERQRNRYFQARAMQEAGSLEDARFWFNEIYDAWPREYYGLQAQNRLYEMDQNISLLQLVENGTEQTPEIQEQHGEQTQTLEDLAESLVTGLDASLADLARSEFSSVQAVEIDGEGNLFTRPARIHWDGPEGVADTYLSYVADFDAQIIPFTEESNPTAIDDFVEAYGDLFPHMVRANYLLDVGQRYEALTESRDASIEYRSLRRERRPSSTRPVRLSLRLDAHYIDNRSDDTGYWGIELNTYRYPVPDANPERSLLGERQLAIYENRDELRESFYDALTTLGDYHLVRRFAREDGLSGLDPMGDGRERWSHAYSRAYPEIVVHHAESWEVNPYIVWALMKVESSFNPDSISRANARGLLQVIPKTGELISQRLGYWDFGPHNLMNPELSVEFGCYYFSELMTKFHGQEMLAFSAYNGGPHNMARWLEGRGELPLDAFIETIPFEQAREYTKKVYAYLALYRMIYLDEPLLYVGQTIDQEYENNIHF